MSAMTDGQVEHWMHRASKAEAEMERLRERHYDFTEELSRALNEHGVPSMPSLRAAIDYLAAHGGKPKETA
jgi:hypothetical protein